MRTLAIDAHCHADLLLQRDPAFPERYRQSGAGGVAWCYVENIDSWQQFPGIWQRLESVCRDLNADDAPFRHLVGIHPRSIPPDFPDDGFGEELAMALAERVRHPLCAGLGELGLEGRQLEREQRVLHAQLDWAVAHLPPNRRVGIHTPRNDKPGITRRTLELLSGYPTLTSRIVIDHVTPETLPLVRDTEYAIGVTLQSGKTSVAELITMIRDDPALAGRIMLNSDGANAMSAPFLEFLERDDLLEPATKAALLRNNASRFFGIELP